MKDKDSLGSILLVSVVLCLVCSAVVSTAAIALRPMQEKNELAAKQRNVLLAAGLVARTAPADGGEDRGLPVAGDLTVEEIAALYAKRIRTQWVNLGTGVPAPAPAADSDAADFEAAADDAKLSEPIPPEYLVPGRRVNLAPVYQVVGDDGRVARIVLPISGKGLWSTLRAYVALDIDFDAAEATTRFPIAGVTFYEQAETAGLGAEVENPDWQQEWQGKYAFDEQWSPVFRVAKSPSPAGTDAAGFEVDSLAGATITAKGVENMVNFWFSEDAFGSYLRKLTPETLDEHAVVTAPETGRGEELDAA